MSKSTKLRSQTVPGSAPNPCGTQKQGRREGRVLLPTVIALSLVSVWAVSGFSLFGCGGDGGSAIGTVPGPAERGLCGTIAPPLSEMMAIEAAALAARPPGGSGGTGGNITIPVYFHVITTDEGAGDMTDAIIAEKISIMNTAFEGSQAPGGFNTSYRFQHAGTDRTANTAWYNAGINTADEIAMKTALHQGSADDLNIYIKLSDVGGYSTFPWGYASRPLEDGVVGTNSAPGDGLAHEAGHWLGLYHTFQGGCDTYNDFVSDTPAERDPNRACPAGNRDTCTGSKFKGKDPTMNFMDYTPDPCRYQFTAGQDARMDIMYDAFRAGN